MKESTTLTIKPRELLGMLSNYYTNKYNKPIVVKETHSVVCVGFHEEEEVNVDIYYEEEVEVLGHTAIKKVSLSEKDVKDVLAELINEEYDISHLYYDTNIKNNVFKGIVISLEEKQKKLAKTPEK